MAFRNIVSDGSENAPRLRMQFNMWALTGLPRDGQEWSLGERLDRIAAAGFTGFEADPTTEHDADEQAKMCNDRGLGIGLAAKAWKAEELRPRVDIALRMKADYFSVQVFGSLRATPDIAEILYDMYELVNGAGLPLFIETHRGRVTQDLRRTCKVIRRFKNARFTGDFSHYVVAGEESGDWNEDVWRHFRKIARRCGNWHGRVGNGESVQVDIGDGSGAMAQQFKTLWTYGMKQWMKTARPGDVLPFCAELGPPGYSIVDLSGREISDRWEQSLVIKRLAEEAWSAAVGTTSGEAKSA